VPLLEQRLLAPLRSVGQVRVFLHTYNVSVINNARSREYNATNRPDDLFLLRPDRFVIDSQESFLASVSTNYCRKHGDPWHDDYRSLTNFLCALNSLERVTELMANDNGAPFDAVVFARPDSLLLSAVDAQQVIAPAKNTIYVPPFANWGGINDRFAFGTQQTMEIYGRRRALLGEFCGVRVAHSEPFLAWVLKREKIVWKRTPMVFARMRANGLIQEKPTWRMEAAHNATVDAVLETTY